MGETKPLLSIGLAVYNGERHLRGALDSLLSQDVRDLELIICDNASTDSTASICLEYAAGDHRIAYHRNESNTGAAENFNRVFGLSSGRYFMWGSDDDVWAPEFASRCIERLERSPAAVLCSTGVTLVGDDGCPKPVTTYRNTETEGADLRERVRRLVAAGLWYDVYSVIRPETLRRTHLYRPVYGGDVLLLLELALLGEFIVVQDRLFDYRVPDRAKTAADHLEEIVGETSGTESLRMTWTQLAADCRSVIEASGLAGLDRRDADDGLLDGLSSSTSEWGKAILDEHRFSGRLPRSASRRRAIVDRCVTARVAQDRPPMPPPHERAITRLSRLARTVKGLLLQRAAPREGSVRRP